MSRLLRILRILSVCFISVFSAHAAFGIDLDIDFLNGDDYDTIQTCQMLQNGSYITIDPVNGLTTWTPYSSDMDANGYFHIPDCIPANNNYVFDHWENDDGDIVGPMTRSEISDFVNNNYRLYAVFREVTPITTNSDSTLTCYNEEGGVDIASDFVFTANNIHTALQEGCTDYLPSGEEYAGFEIYGVDADGNFSDVLATCNADEDCTLDDAQGYTTFDFYAISVAAQATMNFSCGTGATGSISAKTVNVGTSVSFGNLHNSCTRSGYRPTGWSNGSTTIALNGSYTPTTTTAQTWTLQWTTASTLTFNRNGGSWSGPSSGKYATYPTITSYGYPTRSGYVFTGFNNTAAKQVYNEYLNLNSSFSSAAITADTTLYAQWSAAKCVQDGDHFVGTATPTISNNTVSCNFQCDKYYSPSTTTSGGTVTATCVADTLSDSSEKIIALDFQGGSYSSWTYSQLYYLPTYGFVCTSKPCTIDKVIASADGTINTQIDSQFLPTLSGYTFAGYYSGGPHLGNMSNGVEKQSISTGKMFVTPDRRINMNFSSINSHTTVYAKWVQNCNSTANGCSPSFTENGTNMDLSYTCDAGYKYDTSTGTCIVPPYNIYYMCEDDGNYDDNGHPINPAQTVVSTIGKSETVLDIMSTCTTQNPNMIFTGWQDLDTGTIYNANDAFDWADINTDYDSTVLIAQWALPSCTVTNGTLISTSITENRVNCAVSCDTGYSKDGLSNFTETGNAGVASVSVSCMPRTYNITYSVSSSSGYSTITDAVKTYTYGAPQTIGMNIDSPNENALYTWTATYTNTGAIYKENQFPLVIDAGTMGDLTLTPQWTVGTDACAITNATKLNAVFADNTVTCSGSCQTGYNMNNATEFSNLTAAIATPVSGECTANTFRVSYLCGNGTGTAPERVQCTYGDASCVAAQNTCAAPELNSFMGWTYTDANGVTQTIDVGADMSTITSENGAYVVLTAKFEKNLLYVCRDMNADGRCNDGDKKTTCIIGGLIGNDYFGATGADTQTFNSWYIDGTEGTNRYYGTGPTNNVGQQLCQTGYVSPSLTDTIFVRPLMCNTTIEDRTGRGTLDNNITGKCNYNIVCQDGYSQTGGTDTTNEFFMDNEFGVTEINPICVPRTFKVTYDAGRVTNSVDVIYASEFIPLDADVPKDGYTHIGWSDSAVDGATFTRGEPVQYLFATDLTLAPTYTPNTYTVSFDANGGTGGQTSDITVTYDATLPNIESDAPVRSGYTFVGWFDMRDGGTQYYSSYGTPRVSKWNISANTTLYAQWTANTYDITYATDGGTLPAEYATTCTPDASVTLPTPTRENYEFLGWKTSTGDTITTIAANSDICTSAVSLTAQWEMNVYTLTLNDNNGTGGDDVVYYAPAIDKWCSDAECQTHIESATIPTRTGYVFVGYFTPSGSETDKDFSAGEDTELSIAHDGAFANTITENSAAYATWAQDCTEPQNGTCEVAVNGTNVTYVTTCRDGFHVVNPGTATATCEPNTYTVTYRGGRVDNVITIEYMAPFDVLGPDVAPKTGYTLIAWVETTTGRRFVPGVMIPYEFTSDLVLEPMYEANTYTVSFDANGGIDGQTSNITVTYDAEMPRVAVPTRTGYTFNGWYDRTTGGTQYYNADGTPAVSAWNIASDTTLYAQWTINTYTITYKAGNVNPTVSITYGEKFTTYPAYTFSDKTQTAWVSTDGTIRLELNTEYTYNWDFDLTLEPATQNDITCRAGYYVAAGATSCTICPENSYCSGGTYKYDATNAQGIASCPANSTAGGTGNATCACNTGFSVDGTASGDKTTTTTACQDIYIVQTYDSNGGNGTLNTHSCKYKTSCEPMPYYAIGTTMTREGYVFVGWGETPESTTPVDWRNGFETDITLYAIWEPCAAGTYKNATAAAGAACTSCADGTYSESGASRCAICPHGYSTSGDYAGVASCKITCTPGQYIPTSGGACLDVGTGYYGAGGTASYGQILARNECESGLTTIGYGAGADEIGDCGRKLHIKDKTIYLRSVKKTYPSLHVEIDGREYYGNLSETINGLLKLSRMEEGVEKTYSVVDDSMQ